MNFLRIAAVFALLLIFTPALSAQELPEGFRYYRDADLVFQIGPEEEHAFKSAAQEGSFLAVALAAGMKENIYYLTLYHAQPKKASFLFEKQKELPITFTVDGDKIQAGSERHIRDLKKGDTKLEIMVIRITMEDFEKIVAAGKMNVEFGKIDHLLTAENLQALHYLSKQMEADPDLHEKEKSSSEIYVKGYYRKDGTYVKGHTRKRPRN